MTKENTERNELIYNDKMGGLSWTDLIHKYRLSYTTLRNIVVRETLKRATRK